MRGFPLLQLLLTVAFFAAAGWPVWNLTRPAAPEVMVPLATDNAPSAVRVMPIEVFTAPAPIEVSVSYLGQPVLTGRGYQPLFQADWMVNLPPEGADLVVRAQWPPATPSAALRVVVRLDHGRTAEKVFWSPNGGEIADVLTVPGAPAAP